MIKACKKCRREGVKLSLKGERCLSAKCGLTRRAYAPGDHGQGFRGKMSEYGKQLREKQKARRIYGINETQFQGIVEKAETMTGNKTENLVRLLETRLDSIVYRAGFASSRSQARQLLVHGLFQINGRKVTIPSRQIKIGDVISPKDISGYKEIDLSANLAWVDVDNKKKQATVKQFPVREEIDAPINESLIIEFYSR